MADTDALMGVLQDVSRFVELRSDDFSWSSWEDKADALRELRAVEEQVGRGDPRGLAILFAPTGPLQELSLTNGWGDQYLDLADRYEAAIRCHCRSAPAKDLVPVADLGMDPSFAEVAILKCPSCGQLWLRYYYVAEGFSGSGRWYLGAIRESTIDAGHAKETLEGLDSYFYGGSYFEGRSGVGSGLISLSP